MSTCLYLNTDNVHRINKLKHFSNTFEKYLKNYNVVVYYYQKFYHLYLIRSYNFNKFYYWNYTHIGNLPYSLYIKIENIDYFNFNSKL